MSTPDPTSDKTGAAEIPDLASLLREASSPATSCTVPLKQGLREQIEALEEQMAQAAESAGDRRMSSKSPLVALAEQVEALRAEMAASALTFHFEAPDEDAIEEARKGMAGRDDQAEFDFRLTAASCVKVTGPDGSEFPARMEWSDFRDLRKTLGEPIYLATIKTASDRVFRREWSVPFSFAASHILGTAK